MSSHPHDGRRRPVLFLLTLLVPAGLGLSAWALGMAHEPGAATGDPARARAGSDAGGRNVAPDGLAKSTRAPGPGPTEPGDGTSPHPSQGTEPRDSSDMPDPTPDQTRGSDRSDQPDPSAPSEPEPTTGRTAEPSQEPPTGQPPSQEPTSSDPEPTTTRSDSPPQPSPAPTPGDGDDGDDGDDDDDDGGFPWPWFSFFW